MPSPVCAARATRRMVPGLLMTGDAAPNRIPEAEGSGFLLLHKPVPPARLAAAMRALLVENDGRELPRRMKDRT